MTESYFHQLIREAALAFAKQGGQSIICALDQAGQPFAVKPER